MAIDRQLSFTYDVYWGRCNHTLIEYITPELRNDSDGNSYWVLPLRYPGMFRNCINRVYSDLDGELSESDSGFMTYSVDIDDQKLPPNNYLIKLNGYIVPRREFIVEYTVQASSCPRCLNLDNLRDIYINNENYFGITSGKYKLAMDVAKMLLTDRLITHYNWYGTSVPSLCNSKFLPFATSRIVDDVSNTISYTQQLQRLRMRYQKLDDDEVLKVVESQNIVPTSDSVDIVLVLMTLGGFKVIVNNTFYSSPSR